ncbi:SusD/RagB family nutrient-binding outer membrane lipoprotein [Chitinophaga pendula]|uniref:SusD/RagB family nutrient-binding outer membrane lipoprotein n=1 Tax=Chitinophaga TaxID=79328 RepID=UPI000BAF4ED4|nr:MULTISPECIES: SusD/RagB family nutrient-binding outer membrane lipoprotein [Chitinophaga]ASZ09969.1 hypothetical protein CK934_02730 [Chitinophaga sp. MD30]UCJ07089.1 SusD/RagB family nutrient-binding outer membrane lipoprotein [Chitinophaga pendula]
MRKAFFRLGILLLASGLIMTGCKKLDTMNTDPTKPTTAPESYLLTGAQKSAMDILYNGLQNGYIGMHFAQYWSGNSRTNDSRYLVDEINNNNLWTALYTNSLRSLDQIIAQNKNGQQTNPLAAPNQIAIAHILKAWIYQFLVDTYGNVPYQAAGKGTDGIRPAYDDAKTIYNALLDTLQNQIAKLDETQPSYPSGDVIFKGNIAAWKKLGHSLMLRLAIRMVDVDAAKARSIIEAHYQQAMSSNTDNAVFAYVNIAPNKYPQNDSEREINDFFVSSSLVDYMKSVDDPRLAVYARPSKAGAALRGMPYGASDANTARLPADNYSYPGTKIYAPDAAGILMTYPEVEFILAEAAARGFNTGVDAATHYNKGVTASLAYWGITDEAKVSAYLTKVPYNGGNWKNVIGSQKWLALYPQGFQGWAERLRLDIKKPDGTALFTAPLDPVLDPNVKAPEFVPFRLTYPTGEQQQNKENYDKAAAAIGGDTKGTKLWWDKQ